MLAPDCVVGEAGIGTIPPGARALWARRSTRGRKACRNLAPKAGSSLFATKDHHLMRVGAERKPIHVVLS